MTLYSTKDLQLLNILFLNKGIESERKQKRCEILKNGYINYNQLLTKMENMIDKKEYLINYFLLGKLESNYKFSFLEKLAMYLSENKIDKKCHLPVMIPNYIGRFHTFFLNKMVISAPHMQFDYKSFIETVYNAAEEDYERYCLFILMKRQMMSEILNFSLVCIGEHMRDNWTFEHYNEAYDFIKRHRLHTNYLPLENADVADLDDTVFEHLDCLFSCDAIIDQKLKLRARKEMQRKKYKQTHN